jgi:superfamily II DNA or RNA helicase
MDNAGREATRRRFTFTETLAKGTPNHVRPRTVSLATNFKDFLNVPRDLLFLKELQQRYDGVEIIDAQDAALSSNANVTFRGALDVARNQPEAVEQCMQYLTESTYGGGCLLSLPPGFGKTACALYISAKIANRTLILVHTSVLAKQWKERILHFLENASVMIVESGKKLLPNIRDATHIVMLLQTVVALTKKRNISWMEGLCDLTIVDECHHVCARTLCKVVETVGCRFRLGLSATVERKDGMDSMLQCLIGPMAYRCERHDDPNLTVRAVRYWCDNPIVCAPTFVANVTDITTDLLRQSMLLFHIKEMYAEGRFIIVLSDRLQQLRDFEAALSPNIPTHMAIGGNLEAPDMDMRPVLLATYQFASEGLDIPLLNTCIMASPRVDVKQSVGRILRSTGGEPLVLDVLDEDRPILKRQFLKRKGFYEKSLQDGGLQAIVTIV